MGENFSAGGFDCKLLCRNELISHIIAHLFFIGYVLHGEGGGLAVDQAIYSFPCCSLSQC